MKSTYIGLTKPERILWSRRESQSKSPSHDKITGSIQRDVLIKQLTSLLQHQGSVQFLQKNKTKNIGTTEVMDKEFLLCYTEDEIIK